MDSSKKLLHSYGMDGPFKDDSHLKSCSIIGLNFDSVIVPYWLLKSSELLAGLMVYPVVSSSFIVVHLEPARMLEQTAN